MNFKDNKAIFLQIADRICDDILLGNFIEESRIPSVREYAALVEVNANTVMRSFDYLQSKDVIYNKRGIGYFVSPGARSRIQSLRKALFLNEEADYFFKQLYTLAISKEELLKMYQEYLDKQP
ncbi:MAG: GntR family transcriptional regulator [Odoribacter sp.]|nr:GntR family transcriptional regulator [Odoribacter sp.]MDY3032458.1 GntR family transcriptional regulator [Odoribacter sp.]